MSIARLADVEWQLVMHGLEANELLQLARCSKQLQHAADSAFAWLHSPLRVEPSQLKSLHSSRLLRHAPLAVVCRAWWLDSLAFAELRDQSRVIHSLDVTQESLGYVDWVRLLAHPSLQTLRGSLKCRRLVERYPLEDYAHCCRIIRAERPPPPCLLPSSLPMLRSIHLELDYSEDPFCGDIDEEPPLPLMPSLTSLTSTSCPMLKLLEECTNLRELRTYELPAESFGPLFSSPKMSQLQSLTLERFRCLEPASEEEWARGLSALVDLQSLELVDCKPVGSMLAHVHLARSLRLLTLRPHLHDWTWHCVHDLFGSMPSLEDVVAALARCTELNTFAILFQIAPDDPRFEKINCEPFRRRVEQQWKHMTRSQKLARFGARFQMRVDAGELQMDSSKEKQRSGCSIQ